MHRTSALWAFAYAPGIISGLEVGVSFYTGTDCQSISASTPNAALNLSTCVVTPGMVSMHYDTVACSGGGTARPYFYDDTACASQKGFLDSYKTGDDFRCLSVFASDSVAAIMLSCNENEQEAPTATATESVGPVATGAEPSATASATGASSGSGGITSGWDHLSKAARICIICGAAIVGFILIISCTKLGAAQQGGRQEDPPYPQLLDNAIRAGKSLAASDTGYHDSSLMGDALPSQTIQAILSPNDRERLHKIGAAGELLVFEYLLSLGLPYFGRANWTSSPRKYVREHPAYQDMSDTQDGSADFEYYDQQGAFTGHLLAKGLGGGDLHQGMRPTYYIEVKSTTKDNSREQFYVSGNQRRLMRERSIAATNGNRVYVILRVFNLGGGDRTGLDIYIDPAAREQEGQLVFRQQESRREYHPGLGRYVEKETWAVSPR